MTADIRPRDPARPRPATAADPPMLAPQPMDQVYSEIGSLVRAIGSDGFYEVLSRFFARAFACDQWLVMRYSAYDRPAFLVNRFMSESAVALYLSGLYRIDPLADLARRHRRPQVASLRSSDELLADEAHYLSELFKMAFIVDELAILLPAPGGVTIAVCCEKLTSSCTGEERLHAEAMLPAIVAIHERHLDEVIFRAMRGGAEPGRADGAYLILDAAGAQVYASPAWETHPAATPGLLAAVQRARAAGEGHLPLDHGHILHWEDCGPGFSIAPGGLLIRLEQQAEGPVALPSQSLIDLFCRSHGLTQRESDIVGLILHGYPNAKIAERLDISPGTVKNHRWRLYYKLDITSERELFLAFLTDILSRP